MPAENTVYVSIELSVSSWLVAARLPGVEKSHGYTAWRAATRRRR
jgi:hypothetical protein